MNKEELKQFEIKEEHTVEGVTEDFVWYESSVIRDALKHAVSINMYRFEKVVNVMEARHKENRKMLQDVMDENRELKRQIAELKAREV
jgi:cell shape-determining protein MreC